MSCRRHDLVEHGMGCVSGRGLTDVVHGTSQPIDSHPIVAPCVIVSVVCGYNVTAAMMFDRTLRIAAGRAKVTVGSASWCKRCSPVHRRREAVAPRSEITAIGGGIALW